MSVQRKSKSKMGITSNILVPDRGEFLNAMESFLSAPELDTLQPYVDVLLDAIHDPQAPAINTEQFKNEIRNLAKGRTH